MRHAVNLIVAAFVALLSLSTPACGTFEPTPPPNADLVGQWSQPNGFLNINASGQINYQENSSGTTTINAPAKSWAADGFVVGAMGIETTFKIDEAPHQDAEGVWHMTVDGIDYTRR
jgi:hypothetical protein